jgi:hypothetical protein
MIGVCKDYEPKQEINLDERDDVSQQVFGINNVVYHL